MAAAAAARDAGTVTSIASTEHRLERRSARAGAVRLMVVDDHAAVREGVRAMLGDEPDLDPVAVAATAGDAVELAAAGRPDVMLVDYHLPDEDGLSLCLYLKSRPAAPAVLVYSAFADEHLIPLALVAGADAVVAKATRPDELCETVRALARGEDRLPPLTQPAMESAGARLDADDLPIFGMLAHGTPPAEIAATLRMDPAWLVARRWAMLEQLREASARRRAPGASSALRPAS
jgi:DNA-binding NarL/FixJ family response regulator